MCPKCKSKNIFFTKVNRQVDIKGQVRKLKRYTCIDCGCNFDYE